jgi:hypothetical protein
VFVRRYLEDVAPLPLTVEPGEEITIAGRLMEGYDFWAIGIGREECPAQPAFSSCGRPAVIAGPGQSVAFPNASRCEGTVRVQADGTFRISTLSPLMDSGNLLRLHLGHQTGRGKGTAKFVRCIVSHHCR